MTTLNVLKVLQTIYIIHRPSTDVKTLKNAMRCDLEQIEKQKTFLWVKIVKI